MASMIDFKQLMKEERERFKQQTKKNATTLTKNDNNNKDAITTQLTQDLIKEINKKYDSLEIKELKINEKHEHKTIKDFEIKNNILKNSIYYVPEVLTEDSYNIINTIINTSTEKCWTQLKTRKLQIWGGHVGLDKEGSAVPNYLSDLSTLLNSHFKIFNESSTNNHNNSNNTTIASSNFKNDEEDDIYMKMNNNNNKNETPNHYLINNYSPGEGILPHQDGPSYLPKVVILSLQESCVFSFYKYIEGNSNERRDQPPVASLCLKPNSLLFFTNDAYHKYLHSIAAVVEDVIDSEACGMTLNKEEANVVTDEKICRINSRISCTIRKVFWQKENIL